MLTIPRSAALRFRQVLKKSVMADQFRSAWPTVLCQAHHDELILEAGQGGLAVRLSLDAAGSSGAIAFPGDLLVQFEGKDPAPVTLEPIGPGRRVARWTDAGRPLAVEFDMIPPEHARAFPDEPRLTPLPDGFLPALAEAVQTAAKSSASRVGLTRILLRGKGGEIAATDGQQLLIQRGYPFPWEDDVLVPRVAALDGRPLGTSGPAGIGRTETHVVLRVAPWAFALPIDTDNIFPGIEAVIPRASANSGRIQLDPEEAARLAAVLPRLPGAGDDQSPVTLSLAGRPAVRAKGEADPEAVEVVLDRSTAAGPVEAVVVNRAYLMRILALGFTEVQVSAPTRPVCCRDKKRIYLFMPLDPAGAIPPGPRVRRVPLPAASAPAVPRKKIAVAPAAANGHPVVPNGHPAESAPVVDLAERENPADRMNMADVIGEALAVAVLLRDAAGRVARLASTLRRQRHQTRAVQQAVRSLQQLQLNH